MDEMLARYPQTVISSQYYHEVITTGKMMGRRFGWKNVRPLRNPEMPENRNLAV